MTENRIVVGVDGSERSKAALAWAARQAELTGAGLEALIAWDLPVSFGMPVTYDEKTDFGGIATQTLTETVREVLGTKPPADLSSVVVQGHSARALVDAAEGADLLVVGSRGHGGFVGALLGSTSQYCVQHAPCPVVVIRSKDG